MQLSNARLRLLLANINALMLQVLSTLLFVAESCQHAASLQ
jgi:hypothetical protein